MALTGHRHPEGTSGGRTLEVWLDGLSEVVRRPAAVVAGLFLVFLALLTLTPQTDPDLFARVAVGRLMELSGGVQHTDPFSFSPKLDRWVDHEWLSGVVFFQVARRAGDLGLLALTYGFMLLTVCLVVRAHREFVDSRSVVLPWLLLSLPLLFGVWASVVRSRVFTFALVSALILILIRWRNGRERWLWAIPPLFVLWANVHGGFVAGLGLLGSATVAVTVASPGRSRHLWFCLFLSFLGTLINPYGWDYWEYILGAVAMDRPAIQEWRSPGLFSLQVGISLLLLVVFILGQRSAEKRTPPEGWALVAVTFLATLWAQRIFFFLLVVLAVYGGPAARASGEGFRRFWPELWVAGRRLLAPAYLMALAWAGWGTMARIKALTVNGLDYGDYPVQAVEWLEREGGGGKLLVHFDHGSFALWRLYPLYRVSMDGRYEEVYPQSTVDLNREALHPELPGHEEALHSLAPDYILVENPDRSGLFGEGWQVVHEDPGFAVLARDPVGERRDPPRPRRPMWEPGF